MQCDYQINTAFSSNLYQVIAFGVGGKVKTLLYRFFEQDANIWNSVDDEVSEQMTGINTYDGK
jgi:hypothetical protein